MSLWLSWWLPCCSAFDAAAQLSARHVMELREVSSGLALLIYELHIYILVVLNDITFAASLHASCSGLLQVLPVQLVLYFVSLCF